MLMLLRPRRRQRLMHRERQAKTPVAVVML
jgi:hypothetical protein